MKQSILEQLQDVDIRLPHVNALTRLRRSFFALSAGGATRYSVTFENVIEHLWKTRRFHGRIPIKGVIFIEDLVHAVGCLNGSGAAWVDLIEHHERVLIRQCLSRIDESDAIVYVRRFFRELQQTQATVSADPLTLQGFIGDRPVRVWLGEQISDALTGGVTIHQAHKSTIHWRSVRRVNHLPDGTDASVSPHALRFPTLQADRYPSESASLPAAPSSD